MPGTLKRTVTAGLAVALGLFTLAEVNYPHLAPQSQLALFAMLGLTLCFLTTPAHRSWAASPLARSLDLALVAATVAVCAYVVVQTEPLFEGLWLGGRSLGNRAGQEAALDVAVGIAGLVLVLEATRRVIGLALPLLALAFLLYAYFGASLPGWLLPHRGYPLERIASQTFLHSQGVFGVALSVMFTYVFLFVLFGAFLEATGATGFIIALARRLFAGTSGGTAKVSVVASGLMGSLSGSAVANTATTGTFTIPMMKSAGFRPEVAGGIEAAASSGGALVPPVMGAGAYMMLEIVDPPVTYLQIIRAALIPAILYYLSLFLIVHFRARRIAWREAAATAVAGSEKTVEARDAGAPESSQAGDVREVHRPRAVEETGAPPPTQSGAAARSEAGPGAKNDPGEVPPPPFAGWIFCGALGALVGFLVAGSTPFRAVTLALGVVLAASALRRETRLSPRDLVAALIKAARDSVPLVAAAACVGIVIGVVTLTGVGTRLPALILPLAQDSLLLALALIMVSSLVLGMGLPSAVCYLLIATLVGPALGHLGVVPLAAHLFIFYFGMMSMVTPPVALAAYAAGSIAGSGILATGLAAFRFALVGFTLPYIFVYRPQLLMLAPGGGEPAALAVAGAVGMALLGIVPFAAGIAGFLLAPLTRFQRALLFAAAALFLIPLPPLAVAGLPIPLATATGLAALFTALGLNRRSGIARSYF